MKVLRVCGWRPSSAHLRRINPADDPRKQQDISPRNNRLTRAAAVSGKRTAFFGRVRAPAAGDILAAPMPPTEPVYRAQHLILY
jgi:hypothetical protein